MLLVSVLTTGDFTRSCCSGMGESATTLEAVLRVVGEPAEERERSADKGKTNTLRAGLPAARTETESVGEKFIEGESRLGHPEGRRGRRVRSECGRRRQGNTKGG